MKNFVKKCLLVGVFAFFGLLMIVPWAEARTHRTKSSDVKVKSYTTKKGKTVKSHYRSKADKSVKNNYSCIDNWRCSKKKRN